MWLLGKTQVIAIFIGGTEIISVQPVVLRPKQRELALNVAKTEVTILASREATQS